MPRKPVERSNQNYYHITARSNNQEFFHLPIEKTWEIMINELAKLQKLYGIKIAAFVLMNNHFHLLVLTPKEDIDRIMYFLMKSVTLKIQKCTGRINKIFGGRYKGSMITNFGYLQNVYKYIYRNPLAVHLCEHAEDYPYSTLFYTQRSFLKCPIVVEAEWLSDKSELFTNRDDLKWINQAFLESESESIHSGLKKTTFAYARDKATNKIIAPK